MDKYNHKKIEKKWSTKWKKDKLYKAPDKVDPHKKLYVLPQLPYPSGAGLHVGHAEGYTACDIYARAKRMQGYDVMQVIGWDAFGLPAENYAIKNNVHPKIITNKAIDNFRYQIKRMGCSLDWDREVGSHTPDYYKWTQWFFLLMYERGLAYRKNQKVNWCDSCKTVLANDQVVEGECERCDTKVEQKEMEQWYLRITEYADRLYDDLDKVDWPKESIKRQRDWIGRKKGINIFYNIKQFDEKITCFTTRPDTNFGATFIVVAPDSDFVKKNIERFPEENKVKKYIEKSLQKTELERISEGRAKTGIYTGLQAINNLNKRELPIYVSDFVLSSVGTGAVVGVPGHDVRDFEFAKEKGLDIIRVVAGKNGDKSKITEVGQVNEEKGIIINSEFLNGMDVDKATQKIMDYLEEKGWGKRVTTFRLRDWSVSRQRFWGAPIPMVYDDEENLHPVDKDDLPIILPDDVDFKPTGQSPLTYSSDFQEGVEEKYGKGWRREVDTLDTFMCSSWYYYRYLDPNNEDAFASEESLRNWMPVDFYIGGHEHVTGHLLYSRFFTKVLYDAGYIDFDEPFTMHRHQGMILGEDNKKMSKRWGNVINPTDVIDRYGGDTLRMYEMFMGPLEDTKSWNRKGEKGISRFVNRVWKLQEKIDDDFKSEKQEVAINKIIKKAESDIDSLSFNTTIAAFMEFSNLLGKEQKINKGVWERFLIVMAPFAPFITEEMWSRLGNDYSIHQSSWPKYNEKLLVEKEIVVAVQINGKLRDTIKIQKGDEKSDVIQSAKESEKIQKYLDKKPKKTIYVEGKVLNFVL